MVRVINVYRAFTIRKFNNIDFSVGVVIPFRGVGGCKTHEQAFKKTEGGTGCPLCYSVLSP